jgi:hypothetical protein
MLRILTTGKIFLQVVRMDFWLCVNELMLIVFVSSLLFETVLIITGAVVLNCIVYVKVKFICVFVMIKLEILSTFTVVIPFIPLTLEFVRDCSFNENFFLNIVFQIFCFFQDLFILFQEEQIKIV